MTASSEWFARTADFFAYLRWRGWRYALIRQGEYLVSMHHAERFRRAANDNGARS